MANGEKAGYIGESMVFHGRCVAWLFPGLAALLASCDLFSTLPFLPLPETAQALSAQAFHAQGPERTATFRLTESCACGVGLAPFADLKIKLTPRPGEGHPTFRLEPVEGPALIPSLAWSGLFGHVGDTAVFLSASGDTLGRSEGDPELALPSSLVPGSWSAETEREGLRWVRRLIGLDTLEQSGVLRQAWHLVDSVKAGSNLVMTRHFWLGAEGPLQGREEWPGFRYRSATGSRAAEGAYRREWVRL